MIQSRLGMPLDLSTLTVADPELIVVEHHSFYRAVDFRSF
jgi:hypothetical protein